MLYAEEARLLTSRKAACAWGADILYLGDGDDPANYCEITQAELDARLRAEAEEAEATATPEPAAEDE